MYSFFRTTGCAIECRKRGLRSTSQYGSVPNSSQRQQQQQQMVYSASGQRQWRLSDEEEHMGISSAEYQLFGDLSA